MFEIQIWVYGNSLESTVVAVAVPNEPTLLEWAQTNGEEGDFATLCKNPKSQDFILSELNAMGKRKGVCAFFSWKVLNQIRHQPFFFFFFFLLSFFANLKFNLSLSNHNYTVYGI